MNSASTPGCRRLEGVLVTTSVMKNSGPISSSWLFETTRELRSQSEQLVGNLRWDSAHRERRWDTVLTSSRVRRHEEALTDGWRLGADCWDRERSLQLLKREVCILLQTFSIRPMNLICPIEVWEREKGATWGGWDEKPCPSLPPLLLQSNSSNLGPWRRAALLSVVTGDRILRASTEGRRRGGPLLLLGGGGIRSWAHSGRGEEAGTPGGPPCRKPGMRYRVQFSD